MGARLSDAFGGATPLMRLSHSSRWTLSVVLAVAAVLRLTFWALGLDDPSQFAAMSANGTPSGDSRQYLTLANNLGAAYLGDATGELFALGLVRPPGYPLLLAVISAIGRSVGFLALVHVLLGVGVVWVTYLLGRSLIDERVGLSAAAIVALEPASVAHSSILLTEVPFTLLLLLGALLLGKGLQGRRDETNITQFALGGVLLGLATLTRPVTLYLPLVLVPGLYFLLKGRDRHHRAITAAVIVVAFAVPVGGWMARNAVTAGVPALSTIEGTNLLYYRAAFAVSEEDGRPLNEVRDAYASLVRERTGPSSDPGSRYEFERSLGARELLAHPVGTLQMSVKGAGRLLVGPVRYQISRRLQVDIHDPGVRLFAHMTTALAGLFTLLALAGFVQGRKDRVSGAIWFAALLAGYLIAISAGGEAYSRFRVPAVPFLALLGGYAVCHVVVPRFGSARRSSLLGEHVSAGPAEEFA